MLEERRIKHIAMVAETMRVLAKRYYAYDDAKAQEMWLLGYLHDIGYTLSEIPSNHGQAGADLLERQGYTYHNEVRWHGKKVSPYASDELFLLNIADLSVTGYGDPCSFEGRVTDILARYGENCGQAGKLRELYAILRQHAIASRNDSPEKWDLWQAYASGDIYKLMQQYCDTEWRAS